MEFLGYWSLSEKPFENTCDPKFFYYSPFHKEALVRLIYVIKQNKAGALLAGDYGTGKTTIANELLCEIEENEDYRSAYISNPLLTSRELLQEINFQLGGGDSRGTKLKLRRSIEDRFRKIADEGNHPIVIVDEAHLITRRDVLEELRLMMNLYYKNSFLTSIIMMGQLELRDIINEMPQFKQRFAMYYTLRTLDREETARYISHRMQVAGVSRYVFSDEALELIFEASSGRPRQINNICDMSLLVGYMKNAEHIDGNTIREVVKDLGEEV
ncbi:MAG: AAA family ATPase [Candidatus Omnitrophica bacterium]|nr:AAA family ATPase [Candidatus Omnitrophota bacterium]